MVIREQQLYENLKTKYIGLGNTDTTREEWMDNVYRDTYANMVMHNPELHHLSIVLNKPQLLTRMSMIEKMVQPVQGQKQQKP
ncbi:hypothetical protein PACTADRAFT_922 [Pachysolen tannophilus NRRL Y-2460]|uniref:Splicing factor subunit n=1 Tax=Pachysolen tannophilus NRRL Y-2460 TaxID=669874 RepID=A0A1E4U360_PACTA|nr:hypothetical protein PACTADRAFT_922 [Pachysolen tannophilus NRRL Y-2460]